MQFKTVARISEIAPSTMRKVEIDDQEILLANVDGEIYAVADRCGHMSASLSCGSLRDGIVGCKMHGARFDVRTGAVVKSPPEQGVAQLHEYMASVGLPPARTCSLATYPVQTVGDEVQVGV